jgi:N6-L-threonylcarbamoyladenine synthase
MAIADCLEDRTRSAFDYVQKNFPEAKHFVIAGGVAANATIRQKLEALSGQYGFDYFAPPLWLCTDNGAMIAWAAAERFKGQGDPLDTAIRARWPLDENTKPKIGYGKRGAKV